MEEFSWQALVEDVRRFWNEAAARFGATSSPLGGNVDVLRVLRPVEPYNTVEALAPLVGLAGALLGILLAGLALASLGTLLSSLLALGLLLTEVYGVELELDMPYPPPGA